jgi:drug/metabolite transporter (DMT)-like permease
MSTFAFTAFALVAFAANSLLCRLALGGHQIDATTFTAIRVAAGAATLYGILLLRGLTVRPRATPAWRSAAALFAYAAAFSFAYLTLTVGTGALLLFGGVQVTMLVAALRSGERPRPLEWLGLIMAIAGLVYLVLPGVSAPDPVGALVMAAAGASWGLYSLWGRQSTDPLADTAVNFARATPMAAVSSGLFVLIGGNTQLSTDGLLLAVASGALASGLGYVAWYRALPALTATSAATVQLPVPVLTALGGMLVLAEPLTFRLVAATGLVLGGIAIAVKGHGA